MSARKGLLVLFSVVFLPLNVAFAAGLLNPGFESGLQDWVEDSADVVVATGTEGAADSSTYADLDIEVSPYIGDMMARLGSPKEINEKQVAGVNSVTQTFSSNREKLILSFRLFSWEHRGDDTFHFDIRDANGNSGYAIAGVSFAFPDGSVGTCNVTPCDITVDVGKRGQFLDSGWVVAEVTGLPTDGSFMTAEYSVIGDQNNAHATWAYFDNVNTPPVAQFSFAPTAPQEGEKIVFADESYDPDPGDKIVEWKWEFIDPVFGPQEFIYNGGGAFVHIFPDQGSYSITLTVTDTFGATNSVATSQYSTDQVLIPELVVSNVPAMVSALSYEVEVGSEIEILSRLADVGFFDTHTATWSFTEVSGVNVRERQAPFMATGVATGIFSASDTPELLSGQVDITDGTDTTSISVTVNVLSADPERREPNNTLADVEANTPLKAGWSYLSSVSSPTDIDMFEIALPDGTEIPAGSEILISLKNIPTNLDLIVLKKSSLGYSSDGDWASTWGTQWASTWGTQWASTWGTQWASTWGTQWASTWGTQWASTWGTQWASTWGTQWASTTPYLYQGLNDTSFEWAGMLLSTTWTVAPLPMDQLPLSEMAYAIPDGSNLGGSDINLAELGFNVTDHPGLVVAGFSANRGFFDEHISFKTVDDTKFYVAVVGNNGAFSPLPYSLQIEIAKPLDLPPLLGDNCKGDALVAASDSTIVTKVIQPANPAVYTRPTAPKTLFVTQRERMQAMYGTVAWDTMNGKLDALIDDAKVQGMFVSVPSIPYDVLDTIPCSVIEVNKLSDSIRTEIFSILDDNPSIEYVVLVGSSNVIPQRRVPDSTVVGNERLYTNDSFSKFGSADHASLITSQILTDDFYVDYPAEQVGIYYVPKLNVARLVETPEEIGNLADSFVSSGGEINLESALVTGYDFFVDSAKHTFDTFYGSGMTTDALISTDADTTYAWDADGLRCQMFGNDAGSTGCEATDKKHNVNNINGHATHSFIQSAKSFNNQVGDYLYSSDLVDQADAALLAGQGPALESSLVVSNGCHGGRNVPDGTSFPGLIRDLDLDFAQAYSRQKAVYVGNTGFGLGTKEGIEGTERLLAMFAQEVLIQTTVGQALTVAKERYLKEMLTYSPYDQKVSIQTTMYGLPMYKFTGTGAEKGTRTPIAVPGTLTGETLTLIIDDPAGLPAIGALNFEEVSSDDGSFFTVGGDHQAFTMRATQPKNVTTLMPGDPIRGVMVTAGEYTDILNFDPVITSMLRGVDSDVEESFVCLNAFWPSQLVTASETNVGGVTSQQLNVVPGQFRCTSDTSATIAGVERLYTELSIKVLRSTSDDTIPPAISEIDINKAANGDSTITVHATDNPNGTGVEEIVILVMDPATGLITPKSGKVSSGTLAGNGPYSLDIAGLGDKKIVVQVADGAGNVATWAGKGASLQGIEVDAGPDIEYSTLTETSFTATVVGFLDYIDEGRDFTYVWDFGDGHLQPGTLAVGGDYTKGTVVVSVDDTVGSPTYGNATFTVTHQYTVNNTFTASLKVTDGFGGIGVDDVDVLRCGDVANPDGSYPNHDYVGCSVSNSSTEVSINLTVAGIIDSGIQYRIYLDIWDARGNPIPDGKSDRMIKYQNGTATGLHSLVIDDSIANKLKFTFDLAELGWTGSRVEWRAEVQDGVAGQAAAGFEDVMPDSGAFGYELN